MSLPHVSRGAPVGAFDQEQGVEAREMPPWFIDRTIGIQKFKNDASLTDAEIDTIVRWVDAGAREGNPADLPAPEDVSGRQGLGHRHAGPRRHSGGTVQDVRGRLGLVGHLYRRERLTEDRWIKAVQLKPENAKIVHHFCAGVVAARRSRGAGSRRGRAAGSVRRGGVARRGKRTAAGRREQRRQRCRRRSAAIFPGAPVW